MNRRDFFTRLVGSAVALTILKQVDAFALTLPAPLRDANELGWREGYQAVLREAFSIFQRQMAAAGLPIQPERCSDLYLMGHTAPDGTVLCRQQSVQVQMDDADRCLEPAMAALTKACQFYGLDTFGRLSNPMLGVVDYSGSIGPLRMIVQYDIGIDGFRTRFDVLGGPSEAQKHLLAIRAREDLKRQIRRRTEKHRQLLPDRFPA